MTSTSPCRRASTIRAARCAWADEIGVGRIRDVAAQSRRALRRGSLPALAADRAPVRGRAAAVRDQSTGGIAMTTDRAPAMSDRSAGDATSEPQALAERVAQSMFGSDRASQALGMRIVSVAPGRAEMTMTVRDDMLNGHAICHGGFIFLLADSTFAFACNSYNRNTVAQGCAIDFLAPAHAGDVLTRHRRRAQPDRPHRRLRHRRAQPARQDRRAVPRQELPHRGSRRRRDVAAYEQSRAKGTPCRSSPATRRSRADRDARAATSCARCSSSACDGRSRHAYDNVAHYRQALRRGGRAPGRSAPPRRSRAISLHRQERPARQLSVRHVRRAARAGRAHPCVVGHDRQADGRRLYAQRHRHVGDRDGALDSRCGRPPRRHRSRRLRLRSFHRRPRRALRRREARLHRDADVGRPDREAGAADPGLQARHHHGHAVVHAGDRRGDAAAGHRSARIVARDRHLRRGAVDADDAHGDRSGDGHGRDRHLRTVGSDRARASRRNASRPRTASPSGKITSIRRSSTRKPARCCPRARRASSCFTSLTKEAMPIIRYRTRDLTRLLPRHRAHDAPDREDHRPLRRHDDHPRRERVSDADRGADPARRRCWRRITRWRSRGRAISTR